MKQLLPILFFAAQSLSALTTVSDTLYDARGKTVNGSVTIKWNEFTVPGSRTVASGQLAVAVRNGAFTVALEPGDTALPGPVDYLAEYRLSDGILRYERWRVPTSASAVSIASVRVTAGLILPSMLSLTQLSPVGAVKGDLIAFSTSWGLFSGGADGNALLKDSMQPRGLRWGTAGQVASVFGRTGVVTAANGDYAAYYAAIAHAPTHAVGGADPLPVATDSQTGFLSAAEHIDLSDEIFTNYFPGSLPGASNGTPTIADCTTLVNAVAPLVAQYAMHNSRLLSIVHRETTASQAGSTYSYGGYSGPLAALPSLAENVPVDIVNSVPALQQDLAKRLGMLAARMIDLAGLSKAPITGSVNPSQGSGGVLITPGMLDSAIQVLTGKGRGEPIFLIVGVFGDGPYLSAPPRQYSQLRVLASSEVLVSGSGPATRNNLAFLPSLFAIQTSILTPTNDATHAEAIATISNGVSVLVGITNTGSGLQAIYVKITGIVLMLNPGWGIVIRS